MHAVSSFTSAYEDMTLFVTLHDPAMVDWPMV
ncbi:hypothetical protein AWB81_06005 [Caballeronia arationis]|uniref:Uncharacterized protein n=1 Tax=Caballeronia arationis TaxID=1777142 RepID=A0A7Z7N0J5_9BURK|nr:hypothetical protein AWB81_06005 [Caballeronia arationis]SOE54266.1 hypothetical protein SAMN05446927_0793 [Caballeronia arationis]